MNVQKEEKVIIIILAILAIIGAGIVFTIGHIVCTSPDKNTVSTEGISAGLHVSNISDKYEHLIEE